ncbi:hypothetical protein [Lactiplantibacillus plantarum]|jgi:hypothetical protein|uniref:hypothetical protein n=2 Tax=Bacillati TaxID=1783272 RepID=UPI0004375903|nr:hypothetical protein [Lactiplantibacillus plantarum]AHN70236.1 hypothetical protein I526_2551 [Lactiplantibacillus plantarum DOMLa]ATQ34561.1 hypothetical protein CS400_13220 [Lactiplantibacillus plantarum]KYK53182.1 hypothetical protein AYO51_12995 [Lactiplantibacillus plantarum]KYM70484.1 hypothetical protein AZJ01_00745 [Lactiplantibacillus plantarum]MBA3078683.1 hypothetical protein [Lactiplantibacillus plantarum]
MGMVDRQEVLKYFSEIEYAAHTQNWLNDIRMARDLFTHDSDVYVILFPFMYTVLEDVIRSSTDNYGQLKSGENNDDKKVGNGLIKFAIENSVDDEQRHLLEEIKKKYYGKFDLDLSGGNRNNVLHGVVPPYYWTKEDFQDLMKNIAAISRYMRI